MRVASTDVPEAATQNHGLKVFLRAVIREPKRVCVGRRHPKQQKKAMNVGNSCRHHSTLRTAGVGAGRHIERWDHDTVRQATKGSRMTGLVAVRFFVAGGLSMMAILLKRELGAGPRRVPVPCAPGSRENARDDFHDGAVRRAGVDEGESEAVHTPVA